MKKHFLLLMLMALLPLAGFAQTDISGFDFRISAITFEYTGATPTINSKVESTELIESDLTVGNDYDLVYFNENDQSLTADEVKNVGTYKVAAQGKGLYNGTTSKITFTITKVDLAGTAITASALDFANCRVVEEGGTTPSSATYDGNAWQPTATLTWTTPEPDQVLVEGTDYTVSWGENKNAGEGTVTFTAKADGNYKGSKKLTFDIAKINIPEEGIVTAPQANILTYTAAEQELVTAGKVANTESEYYGKIMYKLSTEETWSEDIPTAKNYNEDGYTVNWKVVGGTNYNDQTGEDITEIAIAKGNITIIPIKKTKTYDGKPFTADDVKYSVAGRVGADASAAVSGINCEPEFAAAVGDYAITPNAESAKIGDVLMSANYNVTVKNDVKFTIEKTNLTISVKDFSMTHGAESWPNLPAYDAENAETSIAAMKDALTIVGAVIVDDDSEEDDMIKDLTFAMANDESEVLNGKESISIEVGSYENAIKVSKGIEEVWSNYNVTINFGTLKVNGAEFTIMPVIVSNIEYGDAYTIGYYASDDATIDESTLTFKIDGKNYAYKDKDAWTLPTDLGNYTVAINDGVKGTLNNEGSTVVYQSNSYQIVPKKINITVKGQTVLKGDVAATFLNALGESAVECDDFAYDDDFKALNVTFSFVDDVTVDETGKITNDAGEVENAITLTVDNSNYEATVTAGKLTVSEEYAATLIGDGTAPEVIAAAAANGGEYDVNIKNRELVGGTWNVMVLPFAVNPLDFCNVIGQYAVFNRMKEVVDNKVYFKLVLDEIPANEPFLVKPVENVDLGKETTPGTPDYLFEDVTISVNNIEDGDVTYSSISGAKFIGTYNASMAVAANEAYALAVTGTNTGNWILRKSAWDLDFTKACIKLDSGFSNARFFVEDIDSNGATAIKEISAETMKAIDNDGLYNLNGMKMQGVPTQKGIYIQNGKKVVIK